MVNIDKLKKRLKIAENNAAAALAIYQMHCAAVDQTLTELQDVCDHSHILSSEETHESGGFQIKKTIISCSDCKKILECTYDSIIP